jgi:hypothetical protein
VQTLILIKSDKLSAFFFLLLGMWLNKLIVTWNEAFIHTVVHGYQTTASFTLLIVSCTTKTLSRWMKPVCEQICSSRRWIHIKNKSNYPKNEQYFWKQIQATKLTPNFPVIPKRLHFELFMLDQMVKKTAKKME